MKKEWQSQKYIKYNSKHAIKQHQKKIRYKKWRTQENRKNQGKPKRIRKIEGLGYSRVIMPVDFRFGCNTIEVMKKLYLVRNNHKNKIPTYIELRNVEKIDDASITVLLSVMIEFVIDKIMFNGDFPLNQDAKVVLIESGFFETLYKKDAKESIYDKNSDFQIGKSRIVTMPRKSVVSAVASQISELVSKKLWDEEATSKGLYRILIELMHNTVDHAHEHKKAELPWWLTVNYDEDLKKFSFVFLDYGIGIFDSLLGKEETKKQNFLERVFELFGNKGNDKLLKGILVGELHKTSTGKINRGKGLPGIYETLQRNQISNLRIISNNVIANVSTDEYFVSEIDFKGTLMSWDIDNESEASEWIS